MKRRNGACYPIRLTFNTPLSEAAVRENIATWKAQGKEHWKGFRHFEMWPTPDAPENTD